MKIGQINPQIFQSNKFRLPVKKAVLGTPGLSTETNVNWVKEYSNPNAETLYKKALKTENLKEQTKLFEEMGDYRLIDIDAEKRIDDFVKNLK